jgi:hypothetical protein
MDKINIQIFASNELKKLTPLMHKTMKKGWGVYGV